jgi:hypothetical protein
MKPLMDKSTHMKDEIYHKLDKILSDNSQGDSKVALRVIAQNLISHHSSLSS